MATQKKSNPQLISPRGVFVYPALNKPDFGTPEFPKPDGEYKVTLRVPAATAEAWREGALKNIIKAARDEAAQAFANLPVATRKKLKEVTWNEVGTDEYDKETEEPTGFVLFKSSMKASGIRKAGNKPWSRKPQIFDARGRALAKPPEIWGGSEGYVSFEASPYFIPGTGAAGVAMRLNAVQLVKLVQGGQRDAAAFGFAAQDDGFDSSEFEAPEESFGEGSGAAEGDPALTPDF